MPQSQEHMTITRNSWVQVSVNDVTAITFQVLSGKVEVRRGGASAPAAADRGWIYPALTGERELALDQLSNGIGGRVWMRGVSFEDAMVLIDHV